MTQDPISDSLRRRVPRLASWLVAVAAIPGCAVAGSGITGQSTAGPSSAPISASRLYVCVQDSGEIAVVDMSSLALVETVSLADLGFSGSPRPHDVAVDLDGEHWYVSLIGENRVLRFDSSNEVVGEMAFSTPGMVDAGPYGAIVVSRSMSAVDPPSRIGIARGEPWEGREIDVLFPRPHGIVIDAAGRYAYTASLAQNRIATIDLGTDRVELADLPGPTHAIVQFAISPDGETLVASGELSGQLLVLNLGDPIHPALVRSIPVGARPFDPVFAPDGESVWIPLKGTDEVVVVETTGWTVADRISGGALNQPHAVAFSPDGSRAFVTNNGAGAPAADEIASDLPTADPSVGSLVVIDARSRLIEAAIPLGSNLTGLGSRPVR